MWRFWLHVNQTVDVAVLCHPSGGVNHLVDGITLLAEEDRLDAVFHALANRTRRQLLADLAVRPARVNELARPYGMSVNAISKHLMVLEQAGLVERRREGAVQSCVLNAAPLSDADTWIGAYRRYWTDQLDGLARFIEGEGDAQ